MTPPTKHPKHLKTLPSTLTVTGSPAVIGARLAKLLKPDVPVKETLLNSWIQAKREETEAGIRADEEEERKRSARPAH